ncbi:MAG: D-amino acid dehydrogenase [Lautropia sp.]|nr:D-amino acid dehydrogenase [Lautropia sp.]
MKSIAVIGGGITGVTAAYALLMRGFDVTLYERHRYAAMETSFANGGQLSASNAEVWTSWSTVMKGLKWMLKNDAPLLLNPKPSWHKLSWLGEFLRAIPDYGKNTIDTTRLAIEARAHLFSWAETENIDFDLKKKGILHIYRDKAGFNHAAKVSELLAQGGLERRPVTPEEMRAIEPTLSGTYYGGYFTESDSTGDIHKFTNGLADAVARHGGKCRYETGVESITLSTDGRRAQVVSRHKGEVSTDGFDGVVISAGVNSRRLATTLGDRINVYPVKGYSITVNLNDQKSQAAAPQVSLLDDETKLVSSRFGDTRFRVAGTAEFNGINRDIRADRIQPLIDWVNECFPDVDTRSVVPWAGLRPMMPNLMPRAIRGKAPCVFYNTGHGHLGWTLSAATAEMIGSTVESALGKQSGQ